MLATHEVVGLGVGGLLEQATRRHGLGRGVDPLEPLAVMDHRVADPPQVVERDRAVLPPAVGVRALAAGHREVAIGDRTPLRQDPAHLDDRLVMLLLDLAPVAHLALAAHEHSASTGSSSIGRTASQPPQSKNLRRS